jgi:hypothetical protein
MGYTHYYKTKRDFTDDEWNELLRLMKMVFHAMPKHSHSSGAYHSEEPIIIRGGGGTGEMVLSEKEIRFNGDEASGMDHEAALMLREKTDFKFCKTDRKPYDYAVQALYRLALHILVEDIIIRSNGDLKEWEWSIAQVEQVTGIPHLTGKLSESFSRAMAR